MRFVPRQQTFIFGLALTTTLLACAQISLALPAHAAAGCTSIAPALGELVECSTVGTETITIPAGALLSEVVAKGGGGSGGAKAISASVPVTGGNGGAGARVAATLAVQGISSITVSVGAGGVTPAVLKAGRGGGATSLQSGASYLLVAGGGGGGGIENGGHSGGDGGAGGQTGSAGAHVGGGDTGGRGGNVGSPPGLGGAAGDGARNSDTCVYDPSVPGFVCTPGPPVAVATDSFGGTGGSDQLGRNGGWGGAGYGGGGIGGIGAWDYNGGGGGGGGSYVHPDATGVTFTTGGGGTGGAGSNSPSVVAASGTPGSVTMRFLGSPGAPTDVAATAGDGAATVTWSAPGSTGGSAITGYTVTSTPGGLTFNVSASATSANASGLTNGTAYTFTVTATTAIGTSLASTATTAVTPQASASPPAPAPSEPSPTVAPAVTSTSTLASVPTLTVAPQATVVEVTSGTSTMLVGGLPAPVTRTPVTPAGGFSMSGGGVVVDAVPPPTGFSSGGSSSVVMSGYAPDSSVGAFLFSDPVSLGTLAVGPDGAARGRIVIPESIRPGRHTLQFTGWNANGESVILSAGITVKPQVTRVVHAVPFKRGSAKLTPVGRAAIVRAVASSAALAGSIRTTVSYCHADIPAAEMLAKSRARAVARVLAASGLPASIEPAPPRAATLTGRRSSSIVITTTG